MSGNEALGSRVSGSNIASQLLDSLGPLPWQEECRGVQMGKGCTQGLLQGSIL